MARTTIATDDFNRASLGADWSQINSSFNSVTINSSSRVAGTFQIQPTDEKGIALWVGAGSFTNDQYASVKLTSAPGGGSSCGIGVVCRASSSGATKNCYEAWVDGAFPSPVTYLTKRVSGTRTVIFSSTSPSWTTNDLLELEVEGTTLRVCKNGTPLGGSFTQTDSSLATGAVGVIAASTGFFGDSWEGGNLSTSSVVPNCAAFHRMIANA